MVIVPKLMPGIIVVDPMTAPLIKVLNALMALFLSTFKYLYYIMTKRDADERDRETRSKGDIPRCKRDVPSVLFAMPMNNVIDSTA